MIGGIRASLKDALGTFFVALEVKAMQKSVKAQALMVIAVLFTLLVLLVTGSDGIGSVLAFMVGMKPTIAHLTWAIAPPVTDLGRISAKNGAYVLSLAAGADGRIYAGTTNFGRLYCYEPVTGSIIDLGQGVPGGTSVRVLAVDRDGKVYGGTNNNAFLFGYSPATNKKTYPGQVVSGETDIMSLLAVADGKIYGGTGPNAHFFNFDGGTPVDLGIPVRGETEIVGLGQSRDGLIYGATTPSGKLFSFNPSTKVVEVVSLGNIPTSVTGQGDSIYIGTTRGELLVYNRKDGLVNLGKPVPEDAKILSLAGDRQGNVYGGVYPSGRIFRYAPGDGLIAIYGNPAEGEAGVYSLAVAGDRLYLGTGSEGHLLRSGTEVTLPLPAATHTPTETPAPTGTPTSVPPATSTPTPVKVKQEAIIRFDPETKDLQVEAVETGSNVTLLEQEVKDGQFEDGIEKEVRTYHIADEHENTLEIEIAIKKGDDGLKATVLKLTYDGTEVILPPENQLRAKWEEKSAQRVELEQELKVGKEFKVEASFKSETGLTIIEEKRPGQEESESSLQGLVVLSLITQDGELSLQ